MNDRIYYGVLIFFMCFVAFILIYLGLKEPWKYFYNIIGGMLLALSGIFLWLIVLAGIDEPLLRMGVSWVLIGIGTFFIFKEVTKLGTLTSDNKEDEEEDDWDT